MATATSPPAPSATAAAFAEVKPEKHDEAVQTREAYEYWGYLFKPDKTGTDKLKSLLRGLKNVMNEQYEPSDNPDLTPTQIASFYRDLHGNYDKLFLGTPGASIAFIYKSLGCLHSLQPLPHSTAFTDPTVPALKTEGWIMWQTIQVLLGPDEHSTFLMESVQKFDVKDPVTGKVFPKTLPRECFPVEPDKHMVAWYEGVSERLKKEAEEEARREEAEQQLARSSHNGTPVRRDDTDDEGSIDSRREALAYFRNPLYRHVDGRPSIVRRSSKRPALSPRPTMMDKGKEAVNSLGQVVRNVASPNLWNGHSSRSDSRDRRRRSVPHNHYTPGDPAADGYGDHLTPRHHSSHSHHRRRSSLNPDRPTSSGADDEFDSADEDPMYSSNPDASPRPSPYNRHHRHARDPPLRHSRSHEPTPSREYDSYFPPPDSPGSARRNSAYDQGTPPMPPPPSGFGPSFMPTNSPLFASSIAKQPQQPPMAPPDPYYKPRTSVSHHRPSNLRYDSPDPGRRHESPRRAPSKPRSDYGSPRPRFDEGHRPPPPPPGTWQGEFGDGPPMARVSSRRSEAGRRSGGGSDMHDVSPMGRKPNRRSDVGRRSGGSEFSGPEDNRDRDARKPKMTRFVTPVGGVDGRRYPDAAPWR